MQDTMESSTRLEKANGIGPGSAEGPSGSPTLSRQTLAPPYDAVRKDSHTRFGMRRRSPSPAPRSINVPIHDDPYSPTGQGEAGLRSPSPWKRFWARNKPSIMVASSQFFGALMNAFAVLLELEGEGMHPVQILFIRQFVTTTCCLLYMWWIGIPEFPFGNRDVRWLLVLRCFTGYFGIFGAWYAMMYISLADATVVTFLAPPFAGIICYFLLKEPFTRSEQLATLVSLCGVVLIARPTVFFGGSDKKDATAGSGSPDNNGAKSPGLDHVATGPERLFAVGLALIGVCGAAGAFTALRAIGKRVHPLISVNAFASYSAALSAVILTAGPLLDIEQPFLCWKLPDSARQWMFLMSVGLTGFIMQYLLTQGLSLDKTNQANSMVFTNMLFAAGFDKLIFGHDMGFLSFAGCTLILGGTASMMLTKKTSIKKQQDVETQANVNGEGEGSHMLTRDENTEEIQLGRIRHDE